MTPDYIIDFDAFTFVAMIMFLLITSALLLRIFVLRHIMLHYFVSASLLVYAVTQSLIVLSYYRLTNFSQLLLDLRVEMLLLLLLISLEFIYFLQLNNRQKGHRGSFWLFLPFLPLVPISLVFLLGSSPFHVLASNFYGLSVFSLISILATISLVAILVLPHVETHNHLYSGFKSYMFLTGIAILLGSFYGRSLFEGAVASRMLILFAALLPFWGEVLDREETNRETLRLEHILEEYRPSVTGRLQREESLSGLDLSLITSSIGGSVAVEYSSDDLKHWALTRSSIGDGARLSEVFEWDANSYVPVLDIVALTDDENSSVGEIISGSKVASFFLLTKSEDGVYLLQGAIRNGAYLAPYETSFILRVFEISRRFRSERILVSRIEELAEELLIISDASTEMLNEQDENALYEKVCDLICRRLNIGQAYYWDFSEGTEGRLVCSSENGGGKSVMVLSAVPEIAANSVILKTPLSKTVKSGGHQMSELAVPVIARDAGKRGVIYVLSTSPSLSDMHQRVVQVISNLVSLSITSSVMRKKLEQREKEATIRADIIAHDLKNLLQPALLSLDTMRLLVSESTEEEGQLFRKLIGNSLQSLNSASNYVSSMIEISRSGKETRDLMVLDLRKIIEEAFASAKSMFPDRKIDFTLKLEPGTQNVKGTHLVKQAFANIISNALRYCDSERAEIVVTSRHDTWNGRQFIAVDVADNGRGIEPSRIDSVFERFSVGAAGTGLGLPLSRAIMRSIGGEIQVSPRFPENYALGTIFTLLFPVEGSNALITGDVPASRKN
ncbi:MAG: HAMP domain-containing sensor histidine kinase [Methanomassiliicoccales archaeon]